VKIVNHHPQSGWLEFSAIGRKGKITSVLSTLNLQPGAKHPVYLARIKGNKDLLSNLSNHKKNPDPSNDDSGLYKNFSAASYSPTQLPEQYHRRKRA
jgi:hypothetical protein